MITKYFRPQDIQETLQLLENREINPILMGGGSAIDRFKSQPMAVIDLQDLGLSNIEKKGSFLEIGATATLHSLSQDPLVPEVMKEIISKEATYNLRRVATIAGTLIASDGRSPFTAGMLALDVAVTIFPGEKLIPLGDLLLMRTEKLEKKLVTKISMPINVLLAYEQVSRSPADFPIVSAAVAVWPGGRTRVILGGFGESPVLSSDGPEKGGERTAARDAYSHAEDEWASAEYRQEIAPILIERCFAQLEKS
jgi:CO/xanthine dehydrogenase FAD-binding subunit